MKPAAPVTRILTPQSPNPAGREHTAASPIGPAAAAPKVNASHIRPRLRLRSIVTILSRHRAASALVGMLERISWHAPDLLAVLTYHRVAPRSATNFDPGLISATPDEL